MENGFILSVFCLHISEDMSSAMLLSFLSWLSDVFMDENTSGMTSFV